VQFSNYLRALLTKKKKKVENFCVKGLFAKIKESENLSNGWNAKYRGLKNGNQLTFSDKSFKALYHPNGWRYALLFCGGQEFLQRGRFYEKPIVQHDITG
jgi:hypothetical protein